MITKTKRKTETQSHDIDNGTLILEKGRKETQSHDVHNAVWILQKSKLTKQHAHACHMFHARKGGS